MSSYAGLSPGAKAVKYRGCKYAGEVRMMTRSEMKELQTAVDLCIERRLFVVRPPVPSKRRAIV